MIQEVKMYTVLCDNCGKDIGDDQDYSCWNDGHCAKENAMESNWIYEEGKHYCPECISYDDDDNLIIDETRKAITITPKP